MNLLIICRSTPGSGEVKYINDTLSMSGTTSDGGPEVVFEVVVSTNKPDYIASQESNATKYPLII